MSPEKAALLAKANSDDWNVRRAVIDDPATTIGMLIALSKDAVPEVSEAASRRIGFLRPRGKRRR